MALPLPPHLAATVEVFTDLERALTECRTICDRAAQDGRLARSERESFKAQRRNFETVLAGVRTTLATANGVQ